VFFFFKYLIVKIRPNQTITLASPYKAVLYAIL